MCRALTKKKEKRNRNLRQRKGTNGAFCEFSRKLKTLVPLEGASHPQKKKGFVQGQSGDSGVGLTVRMWGKKIEWKFLKGEEKKRTAATSEQGKKGESIVRPKVTRQTGFATRGGKNSQSATGKMRKGWRQNINGGRGGGGNEKVTGQEDRPVL